MRQTFVPLPTITRSPSAKFSTGTNTSLIGQLPQQVFQGRAGGFLDVLLTLLRGHTRPLQGHGGLNADLVLALLDLGDEQDRLFAAYDVGHSKCSGSKRPASRNAA